MEIECCNNFLDRTIHLHPFLLDWNCPEVLQFYSFVIENQTQSIVLHDCTMATWHMHVLLSVKWQNNTSSKYPILLL